VKSKEDLAKASLLVHPKMNELAFTDASNQNIEAALQQRGHNCWEPLDFFSK